MIGQGAQLHEISRKSVQRGVVALDAKSASLGDFRTSCVRLYRTFGPVFTEKETKGL
jgi:hypothetical protein